VKPEMAMRYMNRKLKVKGDKNYNDNLSNLQRVSRCLRYAFPYPLRQKTLSIKNAEIEMHQTVDGRQS